MNNLSSYCGLIDAKIRASGKYLPIKIGQIQRESNQKIGQIQKESNQKKNQKLKEYFFSTF